MNALRNVMFSLTIFASATVLAADPCAGKKSLKFEPAGDGVAQFELKVGEKAAIPALGATLCVTGFLPEQKAGNGPAVRYVLQTKQGTQTLSTQASIGGNFALNLLSIVRVVEAGKSVNVQLMKGVTSCQVRSIFGSQRECIRHVCQTDSVSLECVAWKKELKTDHTGPSAFVHLRDGVAEKPAGAPAMVLTVHGADPQFVRDIRFSSGKTFASTCTPEHDGDNCEAAIALSTVGRDVKIDVSDEAGNKTALVLPFAVETWTVSGPVRAVKGEHTDWFVKLSKPECGDFEVPLGSNDLPTAPGGCDGNAPCEIEGEFLKLQLREMPSVSGQRCFLKRLVRAGSATAAQVAPEVGPVRLQTVFSVVGFKGDHFVSVPSSDQQGGALEPGPHVFQVASKAGPGLKAIYGCVRPRQPQGGLTDGFISIDRQCEGNGRGDLLGFVSARREGWATAALLRCVLPSGTMHRLTLDPAECTSGTYTLESTLGYAAPLPVRR